MAILPKASTPLVQANGLMAPEWYRLFQEGFGEVSSLTGATGTANTMPGNNTGASAPDARLSPAQIKALLGIGAGDVSGLAPVATVGTFASLTGTLTIPDAVFGIFEAPANGDYVIAPNMPFAFTAVSMTTFSASGTCTLVTKKNGTAVTGLSNAVSTAQVVTTATAGNAYATGDDVRLTVSANSSCTKLSFCLKITRTLP